MSVYECVGGYINGYKLIVGCVNIFIDRGYVTNYNFKFRLLFYCSIIHLIVKYTKIWNINKCSINAIHKYLTLYLGT